METNRILEILRSEIERRIKIQDDWAGRKVLPGRDLAFAVKEELKQLLSFLSTTENKSARQRLAEWSKTPEGRESYEKVAEEMRREISEKPMNLGERIGSYDIVPYIDDKIAKLQDMWREEKVSFDWDDLKDLIEDVARHFYDLGCRRTADKYDEIEYNRQRAEEHLATSGKTLEIKPGDEVTINGHKIVYDKDKGYVTIAKSEESVPKDLEEAARKSSAQYYKDAGYSPFPNVETAAHMSGFIAGAKWQKEQDEEEQADLFTIVALDAAQRAKEQMMKEGLDAVKTLDFDKVEKTIAGVFVKYGMDRQREMMMKEAVEGVIDDCGTPTRISLKMHCDSFRIGDKVRVVVLPKEGEK